MTLSAILQEYNGFNLCVADLVSGKMGYLTNRGTAAAGRGPLELEHILYGLSNGVLQDNWPKVRVTMSVHHGPFKSWPANLQCQQRAFMPLAALPVVSHPLPSL